MKGGGGWGSSQSEENHKLALIYSLYTKTWQSNDADGSRVKTRKREKTFHTDTDRDRQTDRHTHARARARTDAHSQQLGISQARPLRELV